MAQEQLQLAERIRLPLDIITLTTVILAKKGAGKTYTAKRLAELMLQKGGHVVILDITGVWWGLRSSADGKSEGFPITIIGGEHGDIPLQAEAGEITARAIVEAGFSAILDLSLFSKRDAHRFAAPFLETLYKINRQALHLFVDEADFYAPQKIFGNTDGAALTLGAIDTVVRRGRARGIGVTMITQRPQVLNKDVMTQADVLIALRMNHNLEIKAVKEWIETKADMQQAKDMIASLPGLPTGECWLWAPELDILEHSKVSTAETFDSSATPKAGQRERRKPKVLAPIDLQKLGAQIAVVVEEQRANDPKLLRARIVTLERELKKAAAPVIDQTREHELVKQINSERKESRRVLHFLQATVGRIDDGAQELLRQAVALRDELGNAIKFYGDRPALIDGKTGKATRESLPGRVSLPPTPSPAPRRSSAPQEPSGETPDSGTQELPGGVRRLLAVLGQQRPLSRATLAARAGYANSGGFRNLLSAARQLDLIEGSEPITLSEKGAAIAEQVSEPLPQGPELLEFWCSKLGKGEARILRELMVHERGGMSRQGLAGATNYANSGGFRNLLSSLRVMGLLDDNLGDPVRLVPDVWEAMQ